MTVPQRPLVVSLDRSIAPWSAEVRYVFRTLLGIAGYPYEFQWSQAPDGTIPADIYYGPDPAAHVAGVRIRSLGRALPSAADVQPAVIEQGSLAFLDFDNDPRPAVTATDGSLTFFNDIVFASFWLLSGGAEARARRDRWDNLSLDGTVTITKDLPSKPLVSLYGAMLRAYFTQRGLEPLMPGWSAGEGRGAFVFSHDVDYPEMIRWIECIRLIKARGRRALSSIAGVLNGSNTFWKFTDWIDAERAFGVKPAFYFMARRGSLFQYAAGVPDAFYDIERPRFAELFRQLRGEGCEIGLHASYLAYRSVEQLRAEKERLERAAGAPVEGNRHHYWHLDPEQPHDTLLKHEAIGLAYDSSLGFEFYPGFRRGICHPFRVFHPGERRELAVVQLPPAWMDDHFDRRLARNGIGDPDRSARSLLDTVVATQGVAVVDYHARGMNADFYPRYGAWLLRFLDTYPVSSLQFLQPREVCRAFVDYEAALVRRSRDLLDDAPLHFQTVPKPSIEIGRVQPHEVPAVARMHYEFFGCGENHGQSLASLGPAFLEEIFYGLNLDNPYLFVDVARYGGDIIGFSVYASDWRKVSRYAARRRPFRLAQRTMSLAVRQPLRLSRHLVANLSFVTESLPEAVKQIPAWYMLLAVKPEFRSRSFRQRTGVWVTGSLWQHMVDTLRREGCRALWTAPGAHNGPINQLFFDQGAELIGRARVQGVDCNFYKQPLDAFAEMRRGA